MNFLNFKFEFPGKNLNQSEKRIYWELLRNSTQNSTVYPCPFILSVYPLYIPCIPPVYPSLPHVYPLFTLSIHINLSTCRIQISSSLFLCHETQREGFRLFNVINSLIQYNSSTHYIPHGIHEYRQLMDRNVTLKFLILY